MGSHRMTRLLGALVPCVSAIATTAVSSPPGQVLSHQKISDSDGGFTGVLDDYDWFGWSVAGLGDLDGDNARDLVVGAVGDADGAFSAGAVWVLFLNNDGTVKSHQKISSTEGGFTGILSAGDDFGSAVASLGDLDGDLVGDLVVGAFGDDDGGELTGAVWVLFLNDDGTVKAHQKISDTQGGFIGLLSDDDYFGASVTSLGDLDGDNVGDIAVGARNDDDGGNRHGAVWILFLNTDGTVKSHRKISDWLGGFSGELNDSDLFGFSVAALGDLDGDDLGDLAVGSIGDDDGDVNHGAVWILFLNADGTVKSHQKISDTDGGFAGLLGDCDAFGSSVAALGDLDGDGVGDLAVGAEVLAGGCFPMSLERGAVWVLFLNADGTVKFHQKIGDTQGGFNGALEDYDQFGFSVAGPGDLNGDGVGDLVAGARGDDGGGARFAGRGAAWVLFLDGVPIPCPWDIHGDGLVATADLLALLGAWGSDPAGPPDFDGNGSVGTLDLLLLLGNWGLCP